VGRALTPSKARASPTLSCKGRMAYSGLAWPGMAWHGTAPNVAPRLLAFALHGQAPATPYAASGFFCHLRHRLPDYKDPASRQVNMCRRIQKLALQPIFNHHTRLCFLDALAGSFHSLCSSQPSSPASRRRFYTVSPFLHLIDRLFPALET
jgi:hypothetical protein